MKTSLSELKILISQKLEGLVVDLDDQGQATSALEAFISSILAGPLGFSSEEDIAKDKTSTGPLYDLAINWKGSPRALISVRTKDNALAAAQAQEGLGYAALHGVEWVIHATGHEWQIFEAGRLSGELRSLITFEINDIRRGQAASLLALYYLSKPSLALRPWEPGRGWEPDAPASDEKKLQLDANSLKFNQSSRIKTNQRPWEP